MSAIKPTSTAALNKSSRLHRALMGDSMGENLLESFSVSKYYVCVVLLS